MIIEMEDAFMRSDEIWARFRELCKSRIVSLWYISARTNVINNLLCWVRENTFSSFSHTIVTETYYIAIMPDEYLAFIDTQISEQRHSLAMVIAKFELAKPRNFPFECLSMLPYSIK